MTISTLPVNLTEHVKSQSTHMQIMLDSKETFSYIATILELLGSFTKENKLLVDPHFYKDSIFT